MRLTFIDFIPALWAVLGTVVAVTVYAHQTFQTQKLAERSEDRLELRLERIEAKLDLLVGNRNR